jgi:hypothetical protein
MLRFSSAGIVITELADPKLGHKRGVPWQNTEVAVRAGQLYFNGLLAEQLALRRDDHELDSFRKHLFV